jgi:hypothetical protein
MAAVGRQSLDGGNLTFSDVTETDRAGPHGVAVDVHGAGSAGCDPATVLRSRQREFFAQNPEQGRFGISGYGVRPSVYSE